MQDNGQTGWGPQVIEIDAHNAGRRFDAIVRQACPDVSLGTVMKWIRCGGVRLNGKKRPPQTRLVTGDTVGLPRSRLPHAAVREVPRAVPPVEVMYEDDDLLVANKPADLACHVGTLHQSDTLMARVVQHLRAHDAAPGKRPGLLQRLDKGVSGLVPIGKNAPILKALSNEGAKQGLDKRYVALVDGQVAHDAGTIDLALRVDDEPMGDRPRTHPDPAGKPAITHYTVVRRFVGATLVALRLETGRTHQIRAHMRALGHALWGDPRYGCAQRNARLHATYGVSRPLLHADQLFLVHPTTGVKIHVVAPYPRDMQRVLAVLRPL